MKIGEHEEEIEVIPQETPTEVPVEAPVEAPA
jgi:hypothetical protein